MLMDRFCDPERRKYAILAAFIRFQALSGNFFLKKNRF